MDDNKKRNALYLFWGATLMFMVVFMATVEGLTNPLSVTIGYLVGFFSYKKWTDIYNNENCYVPFALTVFSLVFWFLQR